MRDFLLLLFQAHSVRGLRGELCGGAVDGETTAFLGSPDVSGSVLSGFANVSGSVLPPGEGAFHLPHHSSTRQRYSIVCCSM